MKKEKVQRHTLKILSMLLAVSLWFYVINSGPIEIEKRLKINYKLPPGMSLVSTNEDEIVLKLKGPKAFISNVFSNREKFNVDLRPFYLANGKKFMIKYLPSAIELPFGVEIVDMTPKEALIELDQMAMTEVFIRPRFIGSIPKDRRLKDFKLVPDSLMLQGPITLLKTISGIETMPINLSLFNRDEGAYSIKIVPLDKRILTSENLNLKIEYRTKL